MSARKIMGLRAKDLATQQGQRAYLEPGASKLIEKGRNLYFVLGRGAWFFLVSSAKDSEPDMVNIPASYITETSPELEDRSGSLSREVAEAVKQYDPERESVAVFFGPEEQIQIYVMKRDYPRGLTIRITSSEDDKRTGEGSPG